MVSSFIQTVTVGFGIAPNHAYHARGLYRQSGISPCPEDISIQLCPQYTASPSGWQSPRDISEAIRKQAPAGGGFLFFTDSAILGDNLTKARDVHAAFCGTSDQELRRPCPAGRGVLLSGAGGQGGDHRRQRRRQVHPSPPAGGGGGAGRGDGTPGSRRADGVPATEPGVSGGAHRAGAGAAGAERRRPLPGGV